MEKLSKKLASNIAKTLGYDDEKEQVVAYGLTALLQTVVTVLIVFIIGLIVGTPIESLILCFSVSSLRKYSGGAHVSYIELCTAMGVVYCIIFAVISRYVLVSLISPGIMIAADVVVYALAYFSIYKLAPVDSPNKPIKTLKKKQRMRKGSYITLSVFLAASLIFLLTGFHSRIMFSYGISLLFGIAWQIFTLTSLGSRFLHRMDSMLRKPLNLRKGGGFNEN